MEVIGPDGKRYRLVPVEEEIVVEEDILGDYLAEESLLESITEPDEKPVPKAKFEGATIRRAVPKLSDYRERYKAGELRPSDVMAHRIPRRITKQFDPGSMDPSISRDAGYGVWFGAGTEVDF